LLSTEKKVREDIIRPRMRGSVGAWRRNALYTGLPKEPPEGRDLAQREDLRKLFPKRNDLFGISGQPRPPPADLEWGDSEEE